MSAASIYAIVGAAGGIVTAMTLGRGLLDRVLPGGRMRYLRSELEDERKLNNELVAKVDGLNAKVTDLEQKQLGAVLDRINASMELQTQTLDRLVTVNGSLGYMKDGLEHVTTGLRDAVEAMKAITSTVCDLHDIPMKNRGGAS